MNASACVEDRSERSQVPVRDHFAETMAGLRPDLLRMAQHWTREATAADDLVQEAMKKALEARASFRRGTNLKGWVTRIMRNLFIDGCRKRPALPLDFEPRGGVDPPDELDPLDVLSVEDVQTALARLSPRDRQIFTLFCFEDLSYRRIADDLGIAPATVGTRLHRARLRLRTRLQRVYQSRLLLLRSDRRPSTGAPLALLRGIRDLDRRRSGLDEGPERL